MKKLSRKEVLERIRKQIKTWRKPLDHVHANGQNIWADGFYHAMIEGAEWVRNLVRRMK